MSIATKCTCGASPYYCIGGEHCKINQPFELMTFPGPQGSNIHEPTGEQEVDEIAQLFNDIKHGKTFTVGEPVGEYIPDIELWIEVAKEFHFDKPFHVTVRQDIIKRLIEKGFRIFKI